MLISLRRANMPIRRVFATSTTALTSMITDRPNSPSDTAVVIAESRSSTSRQSWTCVTPGWLHLSAPVESASHPSAAGICAYWLVSARVTRNDVGQISHVVFSMMVGLPEKIAWARAQASALFS